MINIGIDLDGTIVNNNEILEKQIKEYCKLKNKDTREFKWCDDFENYAGYEFLDDSEVFEGASECLREMQKEFNARIHLITSRHNTDELPLVELKTVSYLRSNNIPYSKIYFSSDVPKSKYINDNCIDCMIDNDYEVLDDIINNSDCVFIKFDGDWQFTLSCLKDLFS